LLTFFRLTWLWFSHDTLLRSVYQISLRSLYETGAISSILSRENNSLTAYSVTAAEFSQARKLHMREVMHNVPHRGTPEITIQPSSALAPASSRRVNSGAIGSPRTSNFNMLEKNAWKEKWDREAIMICLTRSCCLPLSPRSSHGYDSPQKCGAVNYNRRSSSET